MLAAEAEASMHQTDAGINDEKLLAQDIRPVEVAYTEDILVGAPAMMEEFADWMVEEVFNDSSSEDLHEGGYEEPRLSPTREPSTGWPENTPQSIRVADAAVTDPDLKQHGDGVNEMSEVLQQKFFCTSCDSEVSAQKDLHYCSTCQVMQCKTCIAKHWLEVDGVCAQFASWSMVQWARTTLQVKLQQYQYKKVASEIAAEGVEHRRQLSAESATLNAKHETLKEYSQRKREGDVACVFAEDSSFRQFEESGRQSDRSGPRIACQEAVVCCVVCGTNPLCKRCFKLADRKRFAGDMLNCTVCKTYCHVPERNFRYGHANFKCPTCAEITAKVTPPWRRSSTRGKGIKTEVMRGPANDDVWDLADDDEHATASSHSDGGHP